MASNLLCAPGIVERVGASDSNANGNMAVAVTADRKDGNMCASFSALPPTALTRLGGDSGGGGVVAFLFLSQRYADASEPDRPTATVDSLAPPPRSVAPPVVVVSSPLPLSERERVVNW